MPSFTDKFGRRWDIALSRKSLRTVRELSGVDIVAKFKSDPSANWLTMTVLASALWACCGEQIRRRGLTPEQFKDGFDDDVIAAVGDALGQALAAYTR